MLRRTSYFVLIAATLAMPWDPLLTIHGLLPVATLWGLTPIMGALVFFLLFRKRTLSPNVLFAVAASLTIIMLPGASLLWSECRLEVGAGQLATLTYLIVQALAFLVLASNTEFSSGVFAVLLGGSTLCLLVIGLSQGSVLHGTRVIPVEGYNPTWLGAYAAVACVLGIYQITSGEKHLRWSLFAASMLIVLILTQSRNATLAMSLSIILALAYRGILALFQGRVIPLGRGTARIVGGVVSGVVFLGGLGLWMLDYYRITAIDLSRFALLLSDDPYLATAGRTEIWSRMAASMSSPLGVGIGCFGDTFSHVYGYERLPHNQWLYTFGELGIPGVLMLFAASSLALREGIRMGRSHTAMAAGIWFFVPLMTVGNDVLFYQYWWAALVGASLVSVELRTHKCPHRPADQGVA